MKKITVKQFYLFILFTAVFFAPSIARASNMVFVPASAHVQKGDLVKINVSLSTGNDRINAAEGKLIFSSDLLSVSNINFSNSVLNFWPEEPHITSSGVISFSGVTPGGFSGGQNLLFSVVFKGIKEGNTELSMQNASALLDDGSGTASALSLNTGSITITANSGATVSKSTQDLLNELDPKNDTQPPESFTPLLGNDTNIFNGKYFTVFNTVDKLSGIDHYDVQEQKSSSPKDNAWIKSDSPYLLLDQTLHSFVFVRAVDKAGNVRLEKMSPLYPQKFYQSIFFWIIILLLCVIIFLARRSRRSNLSS